MYFPYTFKNVPSMLILVSKCRFVRLNALNIAIFVLVARMTKLDYASKVDSCG